MDTPAIRARLEQAEARMAELDAEIRKLESVRPIHLAKVETVVGARPRPRPPTP